MFMLVFGHKKEQPLGHRSWAHVSLKHLPRVVDHKARFFFRFPLDAGLRLIFVEQTCANLDQHPIRQAIHVSGESKLPREHHRSVRPVIEQDRRPISPVVRFPILCLPSPISPQEIKRGLLQYIPIVPPKIFPPPTTPPPLIFLPSLSLFF